MCLLPLLYYLILQVTSELLYQLSGKHILMGFAELNCLLCGIFDRTPVPSVSPDCISHVQCFVFFFLLLAVMDSVLVFEESCCFTVYESLILL